MCAAKQLSPLDREPWTPRNRTGCPTNQERDICSHHPSTTIVSVDSNTEMNFLTYNGEKVAVVRLRPSGLAVEEWWTIIPREFTSANGAVYVMKDSSFSCKCGAVALGQESIGIEASDALCCWIGRRKVYRPKHSQTRRTGKELLGINKRRERAQEREDSI